MTSRAFEYETFSPPPNVRLVGPRLDDPAWAGDWTPPAGDDPLVLVGMSSTFMDHADVLQRATTALGDLPVRGLVTTGPAIPVDAIDAPANVTVVERAPHSEVLRHASAVVTHAGHGTVIKSLAAGVPVVAIPLGPRPARQRRARGAPRRRAAAEAEGVERRDRARGEAGAGRAVLPGERASGWRRRSPPRRARTGRRGARGAREALAEPGSDGGLIATLVRCRELRDRESGREAIPRRGGRFDPRRPDER